MQISIPVLIIAQIARRGKGIVLFIASPVLEQVVCVAAVIYIWHGSTKVLVFQIEIKKIINNKTHFHRSSEITMLCVFALFIFFCLLFSQRSLELGSKLHTHKNGLLHPYSPLPIYHGSHQIQGSEEKGKLGFCL
jgi:hypothetical protein